MSCPRDPSRTDESGRAFAGSQRQVQTFVNERTRELNRAISDALREDLIVPDSIHWMSPLASDKYSEYRDAEFLQRIGLEGHAKRLRAFWPRRGPCWDALAKTQYGCILVEAKSHAPEIYGSGCGASPHTRQQIESAMAATKNWLGVDPNADWMGRLYQSANRYAFLYFLRQIAKVPAFLANIYFVDDPRTPTSRAEWHAAVRQVNSELGLRNPIAFSASVFLSV